MQEQKAFSGSRRRNMSGSADVQRYVEVGIEAEIEAGLLAGVKI